MHTRNTYSRCAGLCGLFAGVLAGAVAVVLAGTALAHRLSASAPEPFLEATHLPPLLTAPNERIELRYDVYCGSGDETTPDAPCDAEGTVFVRPDEAAPFAAFSLHEDQAASEGRLVALVPDAIAHSPRGFEYYAVLRSNTNGMTVTLPGGGGTAPQQSLPLGEEVVADLGAHRFGSPRNADRRVAEAAWGKGGGEVGLEQGRNLPPIGGSAFDVDRSGSVYVLDEANRRLLHWHAGRGVTERVPLSINGTLADMSVAEDGTIYVLETTKGDARAPLLRSFGPDGAARGAGEVAERATQVRIAPDGPVVLQQPSGQWTPAAREGRPLAPAAQMRGGRAGRPVHGGAEVILLRRGKEIRAALVGTAGTRRTWLVTSETPLAEVQLAEPVGTRLLVVARVYAESEDEFVVLVLGQRGIEQRFSLDSADWAETAPLSRFRLVGGSLYQLGSTPAGIFVDRFDLEVK